MKYYYLDIYSDFSCLAAKCPSTCCSGWEIRVDEASLERFHGMPDKTLREDILNHIICRQENYYFENKSDGSCAMLDEDGLCRIQRNTEEKMLCITCRKYPRLAGKVREEIWMSMAASCPVTASYLWNGKVSWFWVEDGKSSSADFCDMEPLQTAILSLRQQFGISPELFQERLQKQRRKTQQEESGEVLLGRVRSAWKRYEICYNLASGCVEVLTEFKELAYLEGSFDYFEDGDKTPIDVFRDMERCEKACGGDLARFYSNYLLYRLYGSILEYPAGLSSTQQYEILCEMALFYVIHFSRFHTLSGLTEPKCIQEINWCYRFFAHGRTRRKAFFEKIKEGVEGEREAVKNFFDFV